MQIVIDISKDAYEDIITHNGVDTIDSQTETIIKADNREG